MTSFRTNKEIIKEFCEINLDTHTDWTGIRVETKNHCESIDGFTNKLMNYIEDNHYRC